MKLGFFILIQIDFKGLHKKSDTPFKKRTVRFFKPDWFSMVANYNQVFDNPIL